MIKGCYQKYTRLFVALISLAVLLSTGYGAGIYIGLFKQPFKIVDPNDSRFNPDNFQFVDYKGNKDISLAQVYGFLFPPGTPKEFVDRVLVNAGGAGRPNCGQYEKGWFCAYNYPWHMQNFVIFRPVHLNIIFNNKLEVLSSRAQDDFVDVRDSLGKHLLEGGGE